MLKSGTSLLTKTANQSTVTTDTTRTAPEWRYRVRNERRKARRVFLFPRRNYSGNSAYRRIIRQYPAGVDRRNVAAKHWSGRRVRWLEAVIHIVQRVIILDIPAIGISEAVCPVKPCRPCNGRPEQASAFVAPGPEALDETIDNVAICAGAGWRGGNDDKKHKCGFHLTSSLG